MRKIFTLKTILLLLVAFVTTGAWAQTYELVTSSSQLVSGCNYIIADRYYGMDGDNNTANVISTESNTNNRRTTTETVSSANKITLGNNSTAMVFELGGSSDAWTFTTTNYAGTDGYLYTTDTKNNRLNVGSNTTANAFKITFDNNLISSITCNGNTARGVMCFNGQLVACYSSKSSSYKVPQLYKEIVSSEAYTVTLNAGSNGSCSASSLTEASTNAGVTLPSCTANEGYAFLGWSTTENGATANAGSTGETYKPTADVTLYAVYKKVVSVSIANVANGTISVMNGDVALADGDKIAEGSELQIAATPADSYKFISWNVTGATPVSDASTTTLTVGSENISISANFKFTTDITVTYNFNDKSAYPDKFPTSGTTTVSAQTFTIGGNDIIINATNGYYIINSTTENCGLFFGKTVNSSNKPQKGTSYLGFPAKKGYKLVKVVATSTNGIAGGLPLNIYTTDLVAVSTASNTVNGKKTEHEFVISNSADNTEYWLTAGGTSGKNLQFDNIVLTYEKASESCKVGSYKYATFSSAYALNLDGMTEGFEAYKVASVVNDVVTTEQVTGTVAAGTGLIIKGAAAGECVIPVVAEGDDVEGNLLVASDGSEVPAGAYVLGVSDYEVKFLRTSEENKATLAAGKSYLPAQAGGNARALRFAFSESTGITNVATDAKANVIYNIAGQRVSDNAKGLVIINGKKYNNK